ncbi:hypothetical protein NQZ68_014035 [Dissostichus eleginoides]|nr:hypothetical protein NQZ68_014035 [Dissostichus eleginoides]
MLPSRMLGRKNDCEEAGVFTWLRLPHLLHKHNIHLLLSQRLASHPPTWGRQADHIEEVPLSSGLHLLLNAVRTTETKDPGDGHLIVEFTPSSICSTSLREGQAKPQTELSMLLVSRPTDAQRELPVGGKRQEAAVEDACQVISSDTVEL